MKKRYKVPGAALITYLYLLFSWQARGQSAQDVPYDIDFAGVTVHINELGHRQIQQELNRLRANRLTLRRDIDALRQLTPLLEPIFSEDRLPLDYRYAVLPFESDTKAQAYWNLTQPQAQNLNLRMDESVDERLHPLLTTEAVVNRLVQFYGQTGNYVLALSHYLQGNSDADFRTAKVAPSYLLLDSQSPDLIWKLLARKLAFEREESIYRSGDGYVLYDYRNGGGQNIRSLTRQLGIDESRFEPFNRWLKTDIIPTDKDYPVLIRVTTEEFPLVKSRLQSQSQTAARTDLGFPLLKKLDDPSLVKEGVLPAVYYAINDRLGVQAQPCDNIITLAYYGKIKVKTFKKFNELTSQDVILPGQIYYLEIKAKRAKIPFHVVQKNQDLREIANMYGVRLKSLLVYNHVEPTQRIQAGRILWMQKKRPRSRPVEYQQLPPEDNRSREPKAPAVTRTEPPLTTPDSLIRQLEAKPPVAVAPPVEDKSLVEPDVLEKTTEPASDLTDTSWDDIKENIKLHVVQAGETYYSISRLYKVTPRQLYLWNNLSEKIPLEVGQQLIIDLTKQEEPKLAKPKVAVKAKPSPKPAANDGWVNSVIVEPAQKAYYHIVQAGQTVYRVALINKVSVEDLMRWNNLTNFTIEIGQKLLIKQKK